MLIVFLGQFLSFRVSVKIGYQRIIRECNYLWNTSLEEGGDRIQVNSIRRSCSERES